MLNKKSVYNLSIIFIATIWIANGLFCKVLHLVPRHQNIVEKILGHTYADPLTKVIGVAEILMALWVLSRIKSRFNATMQIMIIATMNCFEFIFTPDLLLWGRANVIFALLFILFIYYSEFKLNKQLAI